MASNTYCPTVFAAIPKVKCSTRQVNTVSICTGGTINVGALFFKAAKTSFTLCRCSKTSVSCSIAKPETLQIVQSTIAKQLSIDENTILPGTKFVDLGADSLDTVEIMMALEETFGVSVGEGGAENIATVQDAADLIEKVKADTA